MNAATSNAWEDFKSWWKTQGATDEPIAFPGYNDHPLFTQTLRNSNSMAVVCDMQEMKYVYWSGNAKEFSGWDDHYYHEGGLQFGLSLAHPDDLEGIVQFSKLMNEYYTSLPDSLKPNYRDYLDFRVRKPDNTYRKALQQGTVLTHDSQGRIHLLLLYITHITNLKKENTIHLRQTSGLENRMYEYDLRKKNLAPLSVPSEREVRVFELISQGYQRQQIAEKLGISLSTVKTHCQHVFEKMHTNDSVETINLLRLFGLL